MTPLIYALSYGNLDIAKLLIQCQGIDVNKKYIYTYFCD